MPPRRHLLLAAATLIVLLLTYNAIFRWPALKQSVSNHEKFIAAIENRKWGRAHRLTSEHYSDSLGLDRENLHLALRDVGSLISSEFDLNWQMTHVERDGDAVVITGNLRVTGKGNLATLVVNHARPYATKPFTFRWRKTGLLPWSWKLESAHHPDAKLPDGYNPGDIRRRTGFGEF